MALLFGRQGRAAQLGSLELPRRSSSGRYRSNLTPDNALRQSAVWAALRLRADLISTFPIDVFRMSGGVQVEVEKPPVLINPSGNTITMREFLYSTQIDLDLVGNAYGIIREKDAFGIPRRIDLLAHTDVRPNVKNDVVTYQVKNETYTADEIWHERQFTLPGLIMGLSPIAYAAWSLGLWESALDFAADWFNNSRMIPTVHLQNIAKVLGDGEADKAKDRYKIAVEGRDAFVSGKDWTFATVQTPMADAQFLETRKLSEVDAVRFFGVPGDLIEVQGNASSVTYANITERNLQFLIMNLGPAIIRREEALTRLVSSPRFVKMNTSAILRMDPKSQSDQLIAEVQGKITAPSEARALMNRAPFTSAQIDEFAVLFPKPAPSSIPSKTGASA
jgi:HK97 family phage portal protein